MIALIGDGGFAREVMAQIGYCVPRFVDKQFYKLGDPDVFPISFFNTKRYSAVIAVGDPKARYQVFLSMPKDTIYNNLIAQDAKILGKVCLGMGNIICTGCILTTDIIIGNHVHLNLSTTVGHNTTIGDFVTTAPGVHISGGCNIADFVYMGTGAVLRDHISICKDVTIGMGAVVVKDIIEPGIYVGNPAKKIK
jgi:sugar O-acyltransferase (sialic acid O-acetyltransferase NeuD family)